MAEDEETPIPQTGPAAILSAAIKAVPAVRYALGVAGLAALVAIIAGFGHNPIAVLFGVLALLVISVGLVLFAWFTEHASADYRPLALLIAYTFVILLCAAATLTFTSFFFHWPQELSDYWAKPSAADPPPPNDEVSGIVVDEVGAGLPDVAIADWDTTIRTTSTTSGSFVLVLPKTTRRFRMRAWKEGFSPWNEWVEDERDSILISLYSLPESPSMASGGVTVPWHSSQLVTSSTIQAARRDLLVNPPTPHLIATAARGYPGSGRATRKEARSLLQYLGAGEITMEGRDYVSGLLPSRNEITLWVDTYGKRNTYGLRYGPPDRGRPYFGSNGTYFEIPAAGLASKKSDNPAKPPCPKVAGTWRRGSDTVIQISQTECSLSWSQISTDYDHHTLGTFSDGHWSYVTKRRDTRNGCESELYGTLRIVDGKHIVTRVFGTNGRCGLSPTMTEDVVWERP